MVKKTEMSEFICNNITMYFKFMKLYVNKPAMVEFITIFTLQNTLHHIYCFLKEIISHVLEFIFLYFSNINCFFLCAIYIACVAYETIIFVRCTCDKKVRSK